MHRHGHTHTLDQSSASSPTTPAVVHKYFGSLPFSWFLCDLNVCHDSQTQNKKQFQKRKKKKKKKTQSNKYKNTQNKQTKPTKKILLTSIFKGFHMSVHKKYISGCSGIPHTLLWSIINRGTRTDPEHPTPNMINPSSRCHFLKLEYQASITIDLIFLKQRSVQESDTI